MLIALLMVAVLICAIQAMRAKRLLHSAIWLAGVSALLAVVFYQLGAHQVAVIELSVGAGLVTVLFAFAIGIAGEDQIPLNPIIPRVVIWGLVLAAIALIGWQAIPFAREAFLPPAEQAAAAAEAPIQAVIWEQRQLDLLVQIVLIFSGVLGMLGLLAEAKAPLQRPVAEEIAADRERELTALEENVRQQEREPA
jgi:uncharacterized MnhB-related membrane protein